VDARFRPLVALLLLLPMLGAACTRTEPARHYSLTGQILAVHSDRQELTIRHDDIEGYMPGMTMNFPVEAPSLMASRTPGELISADLEVTGLVGRLVSITSRGTAPLPEGSNAAAMAEGVLEVGDPLPDVSLIDQDDRRRSLGEWRDGPVVVTFIYTRCPLPNYCPLMDRHFATMQRQVAADPALRGQVRWVSISFDPDYDTPAVLTAHAATVGADTSTWTFLTGARVTIDRLAAAFAVGVIRGPAGETEITHNLRTALFGKDGTLVAIYPGSDWSPSTVLADLRAHLAR
jgi:protein SCO1/2